MMQERGLSIGIAICLSRPACWAEEFVEVVRQYTVVDTPCCIAGEHIEGLESTCWCAEQWHVPA